MRRAILISFGSVALAVQAIGQHTVGRFAAREDKRNTGGRSNRKKKAQHTSVSNFKAPKPSTKRIAVATEGSRSQRSTIRINLRARR